MGPGDCLHPPGRQALLTVSIPEHWLHKDKRSISPSPTLIPEPMLFLKSEPGHRQDQTEGEGWVGMGDRVVTQSQSSPLSRWLQAYWVQGCIIRGQPHH